MIGVDSCVFLIFTTRVDPNKRNKHPLKDRIPNCVNRKYRVSPRESLSLRFPGNTFGNSARYPLLDWNAEFSKCRISIQSLCRWECLCVYVYVRIYTWKSSEIELYTLMLKKTKSREHPLRPRWRNRWRRGRGRRAWNLRPCTRTVLL